MFKGILTADEGYCEQEHSNSADHDCDLCERSQLQTGAVNRRKRSRKDKFGRQKREDCEDCELELSSRSMYKPREVTSRTPRASCHINILGCGNS